MKAGAMSREIITNTGTKVVETFDEEIHGKCSCGKPVIKVVNSSFTRLRSKERFRYPDVKDEGWCIFSCRGCHKVIMDTWEPHGLEFDESISKQNDKSKQKIPHPERGRG